MFENFFECTKTKNLVRELQNQIQNLTENFSSSNATLRELQVKVSELKKSFSEIAKNINDQKSHNKTLIHELQKKVAELENKNLPIKPVCNEIKIVGAKSSDQKLFVIHNNIESQMSVEEIFGNKNFTDLKIVSYTVAPKFIIEVSKNKNATIIFDYSRLEDFIKDYEKNSYTLDDLQKIELRTGNSEVMIHDKFFLLANDEKNLYRVVTGSANFTNAAFEKNFETIRVDDSEELYNLYLQRFNFLHQQTFIPSELKNLNKSLENKLADYFSSGQFSKDLEEKNKFTNRKTGFDNLDKKQKIHPGLYILGGAPGVGKTTFVWQLLNQLAKNGEHCIYFSYETSKLDLILKFMAQENFSTWKEKALLTAEFIKEHPNDERVKNLVSDFQKKDYALKVFEKKNETVDDLLGQLKKICDDLKKQKNKTPPIVAIDYLQKIPSKFSNDKDGVRLAVDDILLKLKNFQRDTDVTFFVISSLNRESYDPKDPKISPKISFKSFKESGAIEYTADVVWGLELCNIESKSKTKPFKLNCIKNRQGEIYTIFFDFYPRNNSFKPFTPKAEQKSSDEENQMLDPNAKL